MDTQHQLHEEISEMWEIYKKKMPDVGQADERMGSAVYKDGALPVKVKRLMALTGALVHGCLACILFQTDKSLEAGASVEEVLEACSVAVSLGGTMGGGETTRVVQYLHEKGLI